MIVYCPGRENSNADALSQHPQLPARVVGIAEDEVQVFPITVEEGKSEVTPSLLEQEVADVGSQVNSNPVTQFPNSLFKHVSMTCQACPQS